MSIEAAITQLAESVQRWTVVRNETHELLDRYGLLPDAALGLLSSIAVAEISHGSWPREAIQAADRLTVLHGMPVELVAALSGRDLAVVEKLTEHSRRNFKSRDALLLHLDGLTVLEITEQLGVNKQMVYRWLRDAGVAPHRHRRSYPPSMRERAADLYRRNQTYAQIASDLHISEPQVANLLRSAHRHGELPEYGSKFHKPRSTNADSDDE